MLRLYGAARSRAMRTLWMLGELGLNYDHKDYLPAHRRRGLRSFAR